MVLTTEYLYICSANKNTNFAIAELQAMIKSTSSSEVVIVGKTNDLRFKGLSKG